jgi:hypothetical protein
VELEFHSRVSHEFAIANERQFVLMAIEPRNATIAVRSSAIEDRDGLPLISDIRGGSNSVIDSQACVSLFLRP